MNDEPMSLKRLMAACEDFKTETTAIHDLMHLLGVEMDQTPKCHPELAGAAWSTAGARASTSTENIAPSRLERLLLKSACISLWGQSTSRARASFFARRMITSGHIAR